VQQLPAVCCWPLGKERADNENPNPSQYRRSKIFFLGGKKVFRSGTRARMKRLWTLDFGLLDFRLPHDRHPLENNYRRRRTRSPRVELPRADSVDRAEPADSVEGPLAFFPHPTVAATSRSMSIGKLCRALLSVAFPEQPANHRGDLADFPPDDPADRYATLPVRHLEAWVPRS